MHLSAQITDFIVKKLPEPYNTLDRFEHYINDRIKPHGLLFTLVIKEVLELVKPLEKQYNNRHFCRIDDTHQLKSAVSIIDKIVRNSRKLNIENFHYEMTDIARFRIVCNFLNDSEMVAHALLNSKPLNDAFDIKKTSTVKLRPSQRKSAERSIKLTLKHKKERIHIEIQVMTQLQEAWDKKDHFLIYEVRRRDPNNDETNFPDYLDAQMYAMSELLYVADIHFDELRRSREDII